MATVFKRGKVWWIQFRVDGRQVRESLGTTNRKVADELRLGKEVELALARRPGGVVAAPAPVAVAVRVSNAEPEPAPVDLATVRADYAAWSTAHKRPKTILNDKARLDAFFATVTGKALAEVTTADVERFLTGFALRGSQPATILRHREILHAFWRWAERQGHVPRNVVASVPRPRLPERDPRFLSLDQVDELLQAVEGDLIGPLVATAVFAGLRREELCWLRWEDLDLSGEPAVLRIRAKTVQGESWMPKTKRDRKVPVSGRLREVLQRHRNERGARCAGWLFPSPQGCRWDPDNLSGRFRDLIKRAGLPWNLLDLRHTFGSQLARKGVSLLKIAKLMGNSPAIASRHYINLVPEEMGADVEF